MSEDDPATPSAPRLQVIGGGADSWHALELRRRPQCPGPSRKNVAECRSDEAKIVLERPLGREEVGRAIAGMKVTEFLIAGPHRILKSDHQSETFRSAALWGNGLPGAKSGEGSATRR